MEKYTHARLQQRGRHKRPSVISIIFLLYSCYIPAGTTQEAMQAWLSGACSGLSDFLAAGDCQSARPDMTGHAEGKRVYMNIITRKLLRQLLL